MMEGCVVLCACMGVSVCVWGGGYSPDTKHTHTVHPCISARAHGLAQDPPDTCV